MHYCILATSRNIKNRYVIPSVDRVTFSAVGRRHSITQVETGAVIQKWLEPGSGVTLLPGKDLMDEHLKGHVETKGTFIFN